MKHLLLFFLICSTTILMGQTQPRVDYQSKLDQIIKELKSETNAHFEQGPMFMFTKPYKAIFTKESKYTVGRYPDVTSQVFKEGDTILVLGAKPIGNTLHFKSLTSEEIFQTKHFGRPNFTVIKLDEFKAQVKKIKGSEWEKAEVIATMLDCGALESAGMSNHEKHHLNIGDTPVFLSVKLEGEKILLSFDLRTYGGEDFKNMGKAIEGKSKLGLNFGNGNEVTLLCESDDERFAIFNVTDHREDALSGINKMSFSLSKKEVAKELVDEDRFVIGLKMECMGN